MTLREQIQAALDRGDGGEAQDVLDQIADGKVLLISLGDASASWIDEGHGLFRVVHVWGTMKRVEQLHDLARAIGVHRIEWSGRIGWRRALQMMERPN